MASGVAVADEVVNVFNDMKVQKAHQTEEEKKMRKKAVLLCLNEDKTTIIVEKGKEILAGDVGTTIPDPFMHFMRMLPKKECRYALYDVTYETKETKRQELILVYWNPDDAKAAIKMIYASSKDALKKKITGYKHEWNVNGLDDLTDRIALAEKLGPSVISLEGHAL